MIARRRLNLDSQKRVVCPKCGKDLVLSQPDGSPLLDGYVHMECPSCSDKVKYTVLRSSIPDTTLNFANVQKSHVHNKLNSFLMAFVIICGILVFASVMGWISLPNLLSLGSGTSGGNIVGSWVAGDSVITFNSNGTYTQTVGGLTFDSGTYKSSGGQMTMTSRSGRSSTASYRVSANTLFGFQDSRGSPANYTRLNP
jgi:predicted RNA-binding Zn-ribbon protein involved in translation (DUF1610 family)